MRDDPGLSTWPNVITGSCRRRQGRQSQWQELWPTRAWSERKGPGGENAGISRRWEGRERVLA